MSPKTLTADEVINEIADVLRESDGEFITEIANRVLSHKIVYKDDSLFVKEIL
jgi:hypothetical protein